MYVVLIALGFALSISMTGFVEPPPKNSTITLRLPKDLEKLLRQKAAENNTTITYVILECLRKRLDVE